MRMGNNQSQTRKQYDTIKMAKMKPVKEVTLSDERRQARAKFLNKFKNQRLVELEAELKKRAFPLLAAEATWNVSLTMNSNVAMGLCLEAIFLTGLLTTQRRKYLRWTCMLWQFT